MNTSNMQPNVLLIISDQHHPRFMGCAGEAIVHTPNLDRLAARGARFNNAYCNFPLCCPSRMSLMTSRYASEIDCLGNHAQLGSDVPTFAHAFNAADYDTVLCGRMHFNGADQWHGFKKRLVGDVVKNFGDVRSMMNDVLGTLQHTTGPNVKAIATSGPGYSGYQAYDETVTAAAVNWLGGRKADAAPFMMTVGFVMPHAPFVARPEDYALYESRIGIDDLPQPHPETLHPELRTLQRRAGLEDGESVSLEDQRRARIAYYGMCTHVDRLIGDILNALEESGQAENTIVIYTSDHGEQLGEHGMWWKHTFYESSVGIPLLMAGPNIPQGMEINSNLSLLDLAPTMLDMANAPALPRASGRSFRCLLEGDTTAWSNTVIAENRWGSTLQCMLKQDSWKLCYYPGHAPQLFDLSRDPQEIHDLAQEPAYLPQRERMLETLLAAWDYESIMERQKYAATVEDWTRQWRAECEIGDPDAPWYQQPQHNDILD